MVPHILCGFSENASGLVHLLYQIDGCLEAIGSVVINWKTSKNISCSTSATENKNRALFKAAKRCHQPRMFLQQLDPLFAIPTIIFIKFIAKLFEPTIIFEDNKGACDCIQAYKVTSNV